MASDISRLLRPFATAPAPVPGRRSFALVSGDATGDPAHCLMVDDRPVQRSGSWPPLVARVVAELNREAIEAARSFAVHAGVVSHQGQVVAFPGPSGAGKSTLTAACLLAGFDYVSDEALSLDYRSRQVGAYPKPLALSLVSRRLLGLVPVADAVELPQDDEQEELCTAVELGAATASEPLELAHIVMCERRPGPAELLSLPPAEGMGALLAHSFNHYRRPVDAFALASEAGRTARAWVLRSDDPLEAGRLLWERLGGPAAAAPD